MPRYVVQRTFPEGLHISVVDGGAELCRGVVERKEDEMFNHALIKRSLVAGLAIGAASFPTMAQARFELNPPPAPSAAAQLKRTARLPVGRCRDRCSRRRRAARGGPGIASISSRRF
jgi:hypothetical protein